MQCCRSLGDLLGRDAVVVPALQARSVQHNVRCLLKQNLWFAQKHALHMVLHSALTAPTCSFLMAAQQVTSQLCESSLLFPEDIAELQSRSL